MQLVTTQVGEIWNLICGRIRGKNEDVFVQWFQKLTPLRVDKTCLVIGVPDDFFGTLIIDNYEDFLLDALKDVGGIDYTYTFEAGYVVEPEVKAAPVRPVLPVAAPARPSNCNCKFTFENFVVGDENRHAYAAANSVADEPGVFSPLYIYGGSGVGKTHLLHAIANRLGGTHGHLRVRYATCDELLTDFYNLLQQKQSLSEYRSNLREIDVLLIDDVHSLAKKTQMQEEFFNMFNYLHNMHKQIVLTSDKQPCEISDLDKRLETRFESGMTAQICTPEFEARLAILRMMREDTITKVKLKDSLLEFLAANISSSVRRLKGAFIRLTGYISMTNCKDLSIEQAEELLHSQLAQECAARDVSIEAIQRAVAGHFGISINDILGEKRTKNIAEPRMIAMFICRELTKASSNEVGSAFGRNHATVLHAEKKVPQMCLDSDVIRRAVNQIKRQLQTN